MEILCECWEVMPLTSPRLVRRCAGCNDVRAFICADSFRVNAQKKTLDVWLNYRCDRCDFVWKCPIFERRPVRAIASGLLEAFFRDDPLVARRFAFDIRHLRRHAQRIDARTGVRVHRVPTTPTADDIVPVCIRLAVPLPCALRLDRLLAQELRLSRASLHDLQERGGLRTAPIRDKPLRASIHDGQRVWIGEE